MKSIKVGLLGIGTVGAGTYNVLKRNQKEISGRAGHPIEISMVAARNVVRAAQIVGAEATVFNDPMLIVNHPDIDIVVEVINGTTNFILSEMRDKDLTFDGALKEARRLGYAEADPSFDIEGIDAGHKVAIMSAIAFGIPVQFDKVHIEGISKLEAVDIEYAESLGYRIKLLGITKPTKNGIELRIHPTLVPAKRLIANVEGSMNGIMVKSDAAGVTMYYGAGAGSEQTASAVIADLIDITRLATADPEHRVPYLAFHPNAMVDTPIVPISEVTTSYYLRMHVTDQPGVLANITRILAESMVSIEAMIQKEPGKGESQADIVILTHQTQEKNILAAITKIEALLTVVGTVTKIRLESLD